MNQLIALSCLALVLTACGQKYEAKAIVGSSVRYVYYDDVRLSNLSMNAIEGAPSLDGKKSLELIDTFNAKYKDLTPTESVGKKLAETMTKRFQFKRVLPDTYATFGDYLNGQIEKESKAEKWLIVNTPLWRIKSSIWSSDVSMIYAIQYRIQDVKSKKIELGDSCIYKSGNYKQAEFVKDNFAKMKQELATATDYCNQRFDESIDPNKSGRFISSTIR